ncbi:MAG: bifunctional acetate--CoA ligase family protein/GNAT family N-acetyltransferase [Xanthomonadales bacterium]|jgi:acetyltransferase|nr:bifunctional acetate--CoA ligase family protein/GNAT family N-acetyltransferase [Xanthomonadales bacterium]MDH4001527.1 bifunctional acetate--CoA ligase family protein/GNAT family N-acetyltransferase [Xanthomonadales bacterium]
MNTHYLTSLFTPESVALFGASDRPDSVGGIVFNNLLTSGYAGRIYAMNPKRDEVQGQKAYSSLDEIDEIVDLAVVATPAPSIPDIVEACGEKGVKMMLILSAGFREVGPQGRKLEDRVVQLIKRYNIRLMGPNCLGIIRPDIGLNITFGHNNAKPGNLAFVSQSGAICTAILDWAEKIGIGFSAVVSTGIAADLSFGDYLDYLVSDPKTKAILLYIEGIKDARRFMSSLRAAARIKPVIALKVGRHAAGAEASMSHTGALVGSDETFSAALSRSGVLRVETIGQLFAAAKALSSIRNRRSHSESERLVIITNGGGPGVMAADRATDQGIELSTLSEETMEALNQALPAVWSHSNPVDVIGDATPERYQQAVEICLQDPGVDGAIVILTPQAMTDPTAVAEAVIKAAQSSEKPVMTSWMGGTQVAAGRKLLTDSRIPDFGTLENAVDAFSYLARYNRNQRLLLQTPSRLSSELEPPDAEGARLIIEGVLTEQRKVLTEPESMAVLNAFRIPTVRNAVARSANEALIIAESIGFPIAMKVLSTDISHKSDSGGVRLNINSAHEVRGAYRQMIDQVKQKVPDAHIEGVTVGKMYRSSNGRELMIGIIRDPVFGPVISFGSGGTSVEVMGDSAITLPPLNQRLARDLIRRTKVSKLLGEFRNMPAVNMDQLIEVLLGVSAMACELPWIQEMDINPLIIDDQGLVAVDARIVVDYPKPSTDPYNHLAIHPYPIQLIKQVQLNDGTDIVIRPIRPEDAEIEAEFVRGLSTESKYFRFMNSVQELSQEMLVRFTQIDYHNEMALIAVTSGGGREEQIGVARYTTNLDKKSCEFALVVSDKWRGRGIAHHLMHRLMQVARDRDLELIEGQVLANNVKMLQLMKSLSFQISNDTDDPSVKLVVARLHASNP